VKKFINNISIRLPFGNIVRDRHVLLVIKDQYGNYLLGEKPKFYPKGICRLVGGGIEKNETPEKAAIREAQEELTIKISNENLLPIAEVKTKAKTTEKTLINTTYIYLLVGINQLKLQANDDITGLRRFSKKELSSLINEYNSFADNDFYSGDDDYKHYWNDYGKMYSFIHQTVLDLT